VFCWSLPSGFYLETATIFALCLKIFNVADMAISTRCGMMVHNKAVLGVRSQMEVIQIRRSVFINNLDA
jgi:hypothetical protein